MSNTTERTNIQIMTSDNKVVESGSDFEACSTPSPTSAKSSKKVVGATVASVSYIGLESNYSFYLINEETSDIFASFTAVSIEVVDGSAVKGLTFTNGLVDRFQLIKYLRPRSVSDVIDTAIDKLPSSFRLVFDVREYLKNKALISLSANSSPTSNGRLELPSLNVKEIDIKILPGDKMAVSSVKLELKEDSSKFTFIPNLIKDSTYLGKEIWNITEASDPSPIYGEGSSFY
jgi:hypothetical protein